MLAGLKFFYVNTLGYDWPLLTKKKFAGHGRIAYPTFGVMPIAAAWLEPFDTMPAQGSPMAVAETENVLPRE